MGLRTSSLWLVYGGNYSIKAGSRNLRTVVCCEYKCKHFLKSESRLGLQVLSTMIDESLKCTIILCFTLSDFYYHLPERMPFTSLLLLWWNGVAAIVFQFPY